MNYELYRITKIFHQIKDRAQICILLLKAVSSLHRALETKVIMQHFFRGKSSPESLSLTDTIITNKKMGLKNQIHIHAIYSLSPDVN